LLYTLLLLSIKEKEKLVIELANQGKTTREMAKAVHISLKDIGKIIHKVTGDNESPAEKEKEEEKKQK
jgi:DNA invertase Pin-like site-specific DNA recombinase